STVRSFLFLFFFFHDPATTEIYTLSLHDALPIYRVRLRLEGNPLVLDGEQLGRVVDGAVPVVVVADRAVEEMVAEDAVERRELQDRKSTRLNSSHVEISYAVFCLKKKKKEKNIQT